MPLGMNEDTAAMHPPREQVIDRIKAKGRGIRDTIRHLHLPEIGSAEKSESSAGKTLRVKVSMFLYCKRQGKDPGESELCQADYGRTSRRIIGGVVVGRTHRL